MISEVEDQLAAQEEEDRKQVSAVIIPEAEEVAPRTEIISTSTQQINPIRSPAPELMTLALGNQSTNVTKHKEGDTPDPTSSRLLSQSTSLPLPVNPSLTSPNPSSTQPDPSTEFAENALSTGAFAAWSSASAAPRFDLRTQLSPSPEPQNAVTVPDAPQAPPSVIIDLTSDSPIDEVVQPRSSSTESANLAEAEAKFLETFTAAIRPGIKASLRVDAASRFKLMNDEKAFLEFLVHAAPRTLLQMVDDMQTTTMNDNLSSKAKQDFVNFYVWCRSALPSAWSKCHSRVHQAFQQEAAHIPGLMPQVAQTNVSPQPSTSLVTLAQSQTVPSHGSQPQMIHHPAPIASRVAHITPVSKSQNRQVQSFSHIQQTTTQSQQPSSPSTSRSQFARLHGPPLTSTQSAPPGQTVFYTPTGTTVNSNAPILNRSTPKPTEQQPGSASADVLASSHSAWIALSNNLGVQMQSVWYVTI